jgi:hypothetical protein
LDIVFIYEQRGLSREGYRTPFFCQKQIERRPTKPQKNEFSSSCSHKFSLSIHCLSIFLQEN